MTPVKNEQTPPIFSRRCFPCPVAVDTWHWERRDVLRQVMETLDWKVLYVFGLRLAMWRIFKD